jgi:hypothetical protein
MYYVMTCPSPPAGDHALLTYDSDHPRRSWASGNKFSSNPTDPTFRQPPPEPVRAEVMRGYAGIMAEFWDDPVPLMTKRLHKALQDAGVGNLDSYKAEIFDPHTNTTDTNYVAFNIVGKIAAADLTRSVVAPSSQETMIAMDLDSLAIDDLAARGSLLFRLAESVNAIIVHESVKKHLEANGIDTLTFIEPEDWAG